MKKPKSDTRIILIISAIFILLTGLMIAKNFPDTVGEEGENGQERMQQAAEVSKTIALGAVQDAEPESLSEPESESEPESPQMDIAEAYDLLNQDILKPLTWEWYADSAEQKIDQYKDKSRSSFEPVPYKGNIFPAELITRAEEGLYHGNTAAEVLDYLGTDDFRPDIDELHQLFPDKLGDKSEYESVQSDSRHITGSDRAAGIYHLGMISGEDRYVIIYGQDGLETACIQLVKRKDSGFEIIAETAIDDRGETPLFDCGRVIRYEDAYYYAYLYRNDRLEECADGIKIHKLGTNMEEESISIKYLPETYAWENIYRNGKFDAAFHEELDTYIDSIKTELASDAYLENGQEGHPGIYFGDEEEVQELTGDNYEKYYKADIANTGIPVYMVKSSAYPPYGWHVGTEFYLYDEEQDALMELENMESFWPWNTLVQFWVKETSGKTLAFRLYHFSDYDYVLNVILMEGDKVTEIRNDFFVPESGRFVLTEGESSRQNAGGVSNGGTAPVLTDEVYLFKREVDRDAYKGGKIEVHYPQIQGGASEAATQRTNLIIRDTAFAYFDYNDEKTYEEAINFIQDTTQETIYSVTIDYEILAFTESYISILFSARHENGVRVNLSAYLATIDLNSGQYIHFNDLMDVEELKQVMRRNHFKIYDGTDAFFREEHAHEPDILEEFIEELEEDMARPDYNLQDGEKMVHTQDNPHYDHSGFQNIGLDEDYLYVEFADYKDYAIDGYFILQIPLEYTDYGKDAVRQVYKRVKDIDFSIQEYPIDTDVYDADMDEEYKNVFLQVLYSQQPIQYVVDGEHHDYYFRETRPELETDNAEEYADFLKYFFRYYYLDFDGDGLPELIVCSRLEKDPHFGGPRILKYNPEDKQVYNIRSGDLQKWRPLCAGKMYYFDYSHFGVDRCGYMEIDVHGEATEKVEFYYGYYDPNFYLVAIDEFADVDVGEEIWNELIQDLLEAMDHAIQPMTYEEVFGDVTLVNG